MYIANRLENMARMLFKLAWNILGTRRLKFVQMKSLGSQIAPSPERGQKGEFFFLVFFFWTSRSNAKI